MSKSETSQVCWHFLTQLAAQDSFLGTADQQLQLTEEIEKVSEAVTRLEKDISSKLDRLVDETDNEFISLVDTLKQSQSSVSDIFDQLSNEPKNAQANIQTSIALSQQLQDLSRMVRPRMLRVIDKFSPRYKVLEKTLDGLPNLYQHMIKPLPEFILLFLTNATRGQALVENGIMTEMVVKEKLAVDPTKG